VSEGGLPRRAGGFPYGAKLALVLLAGLAGRLAYVAAAPRYDPAFFRPALDGAYYLDWARRIAAGESWPPGAYYLAPLYPHLLAGFFALFGNSLLLLYAVQQGLLVLAAWAVASFARREAGEGAGLATAGIVLLSSPLLFFGSKPVGESLGLFLVSVSLVLAGLGAPVSAAAAGVVAGLAALARPNLLLVPLLWAAVEASRRRYRRAGLLLCGTALALAPVASRNFIASGHLVLISSNGGITLYHGNGPGALGIYTPAEGLSGRLDTQRQEATTLARARSGLELDEVEADRWWGREALRARLADPAGTVLLVARRLWLLLDNREHGLDDNPSLDRNPWRFVAPLPFAALLFLAVCGVGRAGFDRTGGAILWAALGGAAFAPIAFYVSSRYRLPFVLLLSIPAGAGLAEVGKALGRPARWRGLARPVGAAVAAAAVSLGAPFGDLARAEEAGALGNLAAARKQAGDLEGSEALLRDALALDPSCAGCWYNLGVVLETRGRAGQAERAYREALARDRGLAEASGNLAGILIRSGRSKEAIGLLREALARRPGHGACWTNLVVALAEAGDLQAARREASEAVRAGVALDPGLLDAIGAGPEAEEPRPAGPPSGGIRPRVVD